MEEQDPYSDFVRDYASFIMYESFARFPSDQALEIIMSIGATLIMNALNELPLENRERFKELVLAGIERTTNGYTGSIQ